MDKSIQFYVSELDIRVPVGRKLIYPSQNRSIHKSRMIEGKWRKVRNFLDEFLESSSIHGLGHLAAKEKHFAEYFLWTVILIGALIGLSYMGFNAWRRFQDNPTVISMEKDYKNWNTSFAMVTLCPKVRINEEKLIEIAERYNMKDINGFVKFFTKLSTANYGDFEDLPDYSEIDPQDYIKILYEARFDFKYQLSNSHGIEQFPMIIITENGLCHGINTDVGIYFTPENFNRKIPIKRGNGNLVTVNPLDGEVFIQTMLLNSGFNMSITGPFELPDVSVRRMESEVNRFLMVELGVLPIVSGERVRSLTPKQRKCRFYDESNLQLSDLYTYSMCRMQCRADLALKLCKCIPYFYQKSLLQNYCNVDGMRCLGKHARFLSILRDPITDQKVQCGCLPLCNDFHYIIVQESLMKWPVNTHFKYALGEFPRTRLKREVIFGFDDFLVSIGGSAGLLLGCSVLSFIEIIYFFTLRLFFFLRN